MRQKGLQPPQTLLQRLVCTRNTWIASACRPMVDCICPEHAEEQRGRG